MKKIFVLGKKEKLINYADAIEKSGATAVFSNHIEDSFGCDALLLPGGDDVDPFFYNEENIACEGVDNLLDQKEFKLIKLFIDSDKPIFGICRGIQSLNVALGGSLIQDVPNVSTHSRCGQDFDKLHAIKANGESFLTKLYGENFTVNSAHHQAIKIPAPCFEVIAYSNDGLVEAVKHVNKNIFGLQWHPERLAFNHKTDEAVDGALVFEYFISLL